MPPKFIHSKLSAKDNGLHCFSISLLSSGGGNDADHHPEVADGDW